MNQLIVSVKSNLKRKRCEQLIHQPIILLAHSSVCRINVNGDLADRQPLLIHPGTSNFFYPNDNAGIITMENNQEMELFCSQGFASPSGLGQVTRNRHWLPQPQRHRVPGSLPSGLIRRYRRV